MAPQHDLERLITPSIDIPQNNEQITDESVQNQSDNFHVVVIPQLENVLAEDPFPGKKKSGTGKGRKRKNSEGEKKVGSHSTEQPRNCPHLETALFFFGVAGMIVSVIMLLLHSLRKITPYY